VRGSIGRRAICALLAAGAVAGGAAAAPAQAGLGGVTDISDRQERRACEYAKVAAAPSKRRRYVRACRRSAAIERRAARAGFVRTAAATSYQNPVYGASIADPGPLRNTATDYYAYATGSGFPIFKSTDLVNWSAVGKAFTARPSWVVTSGDWHPWAPSVLRSSRSCPGKTSPGCYFMYYGGLSRQHVPATDCVGVAWSLTPSGPFTDLGPIQATDGRKDRTGRPPGCGDDAGYGNIDAAPFVDTDGRVYLYVSTSRRCVTPTPNACPYTPIISVLPLSSDLVRTAPRKALFGATAGSWEQEPGYDPQVENPWMEKRGSRYYIFYSGGFYRSHYGMGYATGSSPTGAFSKAALNPILRETSAVLSPGGGSVTTGPRGGSWLVYHGRAGSYDAARTMRIDPLVWASTGTVSTPGPTTTRRTPAP
jgi:beta-xylosidase